MSRSNYRTKCRWDTNGIKKPKWEALLYIVKVYNKWRYSLTVYRDIKNNNQNCPGGKAPQFLASILIKFVAVGAQKYTSEDDGFDGFGVRLEIIKSRVSQAGQYVNLVYDKNNGIDSLRSSILYAKELGLTGGNKNSFYFTSHPDQKFKLKTVHEEFKERRELYKVMYSNIIPVLEKRLTTIEESDLDVLEEESDYSY